MVVSDKHRFVFIQVPQTASTFLAKFFVDNFEGKHILDKHSTHTAFLDVASTVEKKYRCVIGKRNPMDKAVTRYVRRINRRNIQHESIDDMQAHFGRWFRAKYIEIGRNAWNPHLRLSYPVADFVISQEKLVSELGSVMKALDLDPVDIPVWKRRTKNKLADYSQYYSESLIPHVLEIFKDELIMLGYETPAWCHQSKQNQGRGTEFVSGAIKNKPGGSPRIPDLRS